jgi:type II secretory ATPase GspE/PulE/Tfp pilus assembly ATPase PilB-like protein
MPEKFLRPTGCRACGNLGYKGRIGIFEILKVTPAITQLVADKRSVDEVRSKAKSEGMTTMEADGLMKVLAGVTTLEELFRITKEES